MADKNFFDKYELYTEGDSVYCYPDIGVLKNKLNIKDIVNVRQAEAEIVFAGLLELELKPLQGNFDKAHLYNIHRFLFGPFYDFAGMARTEDISKGKTKFCVWNFIDDQLDELFGKLKPGNKKLKGEKAVSEHLAFLMTELNMIHPFREGNGRAIREFIREYALSLGYTLDWSLKNKTEWMDAMIDSVFDNTLLRHYLTEILRKN